MKKTIKLVAVDIDGTFVRSDYTYDIPRFKRILAAMTKAGCQFVVASGNQYYQLRDLFLDYDEALSFVAENGAFVKDHKDVIFTANMPKKTVDAVIDVCRQYPEIKNVLCGLESAYCERGTVSQNFYELTNHYYHRLQWVDDFKAVEDTILKFAPTVPADKTDDYYDLFQEKLAGEIVPTTSGHGSIDLIVPGCHKASGLKRLAERWEITPAECMAFGDGGNDIEMLTYCAESYAMANAAENVKQAAKYTCPSNEDDGVLVTLEKLFL
ncbi:Cof-type HAD-IIB family hydrolase [Streptococcus troglodytae]|uniref:Cof family hydrolase n=1 Tax=Streptococcus troglodytae TaxID=1111760 RepID=A0A1L7LJT7_9STRE|nr:Cof-type HAD-IIB family hydrolase [Streptococcus troglodytae]BAQ24464.1 cof family hydrolase [Streptococcus troglodytae]